MNQQPTGDQIVSPPSQANGVMVDLLHPQEAPASAPMNVEPISYAAPVIPDLPPLPPAAPMPTPIAPTTGPVQIGTTQQPRSRKPFPTKIVAILLGLLIILVTGAGAAFYFLQPKPAPVAQIPVQAEVGPISNLSQVNSSATIAAGGITNQTTVNLKFDFKTSANRGNIVPEVEVATVGTAFTNSPTTTGNPIEANSKTLSFLVPVADQKDGSYHWQARIKVGNQAGEWTSFSADTISYGIDTVAPIAPTISTVDGKKVNGAKVSIASVRPVVSGSGEAGSTIDLTVKPEGISYMATTGTDGKWTITPTADVPNGEHMIAISSTDTAGNTSNTEFSMSVNPVANTAPEATPSAPKSDSNLAPTGDPITPVALAALIALATSSIGLWRLSRRNER